MASIASCPFPGVDRFKDCGEKNKVVGYIDSVLSGFAQIVLSDNPVTGLLVMLGVFLAAPSQLLAALTAACTAVPFAHLVGVNPFLIRHGYYSFSAAVCGLGVSLWGFSVQPVYPQLLLYSALAGVLSVILFAAVGAFLAKWEVPGLSVAYWITLMIMIPTLHYASGLNAVPFLSPALSEVTQTPMTFELSTFAAATIAGIAEICFQFETASGICLLLAILVSSRVDALVALICSAAGTAVAIAIGLPEGNILIGLYGFNAALTGIGLFGRAFRMSVASALFTLVMAAASVFLMAALSAVFLPLGIPVAALPFGLIVITCMITKSSFGKLTPVSALLWGVPETIEKALKAKDAEEKQAVSY